LIGRNNLSDEYFNFCKELIMKENQHNLAIPPPGSSGGGSRLGRSVAGIERICARLYERLGTVPPGFGTKETEFGTPKTMFRTEETQLGSPKTKFRTKKP
jgi:hypothetical protein